MRERNLLGRRRLLLAAPSLIRLVCGVVVVGGVMSCEGEPSEPAPVFPAGALATWLELRDCRLSHEHELRWIRVLASPTAEAPYTALSADVPYPSGAVLLKAEYDDATCSVPLGFTAMHKEAAGYWDEGHDWRWQKTDAERKVLQNGRLETCVGCHLLHCEPPTCHGGSCGFDLTCGEEL